jgi:hypothetical protein
MNSAQAIEGNGEIRIRTWKEGNGLHRHFGQWSACLPKFRRGSSSKGLPQKMQMGTGLGLPMPEIVEAHGRIEIRSEVGKVPPSPRPAARCRFSQIRKDHEWIIRLPPSILIVDDEKW